jgi:DNA mismatch repair protein MutS2
MRDRQLNFNPDIDVRGMRADEATHAVMYFLDDALQFSISRVRILHGTGTGALRVSLRKYLDTVPGVKSYRDEDVRFGGAGITVVEL